MLHAETIAPNTDLLEQNIWPRLGTFGKHSSIVLVGSRGAGKRSLGFIAAAKLGRRFVSEEQCFTSLAGCSRAQYVRKHGNSAFCVKSIEVLRHMLSHNQTGCIIECGMGTLARDAQILLKDFATSNPIIYIFRDPQRIRQLLKLDEEGAARLAQADSTHRFCSNLEFYNLYDQTCEENEAESDLDQDRSSPNYSFRLKNAKEEFSSFLDLVTSPEPRFDDSEDAFSILAASIETRSHTYALRLRFSDYLDGSLDIDDIELESCGDIAELIIDIATSWSLRDLARLVALIRRKFAMPLMVDVEIGVRWHLGEQSYTRLIQYCFRLGLHYVVVDLNGNPESVHQLIQSKGLSKVVGSYLDTRQSCMNPWSDGYLLKRYLLGNDYGCDIVKIMRRAKRKESDEDLDFFRESVSKATQTKPSALLIAFKTGRFGHASQISNRTFTPVSALMRSDIGEIIKRDFDYLSAQEAMSYQFSRGVMDPLKFYITGESVFYSLSPALHHAAYNVCGMRHDYQLMQTTSLDDLRQTARSPSFGGASISQPFKVSIIQDLRVMSKHATAIGAVNTLLPIRDYADGRRLDYSFEFLRYQAEQRGRVGTVIAWYGDNTDWIGVTACLQRNITPRNTIQRSTTALVIGAGGMARAAIYAIIRLGCRKIYIHNRSIDRALQVAEHFNRQQLGSVESGKDPIIDVLLSINDPWPAERQAPKIIVSAIPAHSIGGQQAANFELPMQWLGSTSGGAVLEMAYKPLMTPLIQQMLKLRESGQHWNIANGLELLPEQGFAQFELMTGRKAPKGKMRQEILRRYQEFGDAIEA